MPFSIRRALNELPVTLDETYERALQGIPKEKWQHAHHLFMCLIAAIRPLRVEELAEIFAIDFDSDPAVPSVMEGFRPDNPEEAVLSACSTLIAVTNDKSSKIVQFSHFSVREFLTSDRLRTSRVKTICRHYIPLDVAHMILARACLTELLQLDENMDNERLATFPLARYAAWHWADHAKFEDVASRVQDMMERLFDPRKSYLAAWIRIHDVDGTHGRHLLHLPRPKGTALYYAILCGFNGLANLLIVAHTEDVNVKCGYQGSPLYAALYIGDLDSARLLLDRGADANLDAFEFEGVAPLVRAYEYRNLEAMQLLLEYGADVNVRFGRMGFILHAASYLGQAEVVRLLLRYDGDVNARDLYKKTPLHWASSNGRPKVVELLLNHGADVNALSRGLCGPLRMASERGHLEVVQLLLAHGANVHARDKDNRTAFQLATSRGHIEVAQLLLEHAAEKECKITSTLLYAWFRVVYLCVMRLLFR
jgi:ankyrin repeat protein